jgi:hypothetical protein
MEYVKYEPFKLKQSAINRWYVTKTEEELIEFNHLTMKGDINKWLIEGFKINENPCKEEFRSKRRNKIPESKKMNDYSYKDLELYFPWNNPAVEKSGFWFVPTYLKSYAFTQVECNFNHKANLNLRTCGGMTLWLNNEFITDFTPYTRNIEADMNIEVEFKKGINKLAVFFDDLAERDTYYYFRIDYCGSDSLDIVIPVDNKYAKDLKKIENMFQDAYLIEDTVKADEVIINMKNLIDRDIEFQVNYL